MKHKPLLVKAGLSEHDYQPKLRPHEQLDEIIDSMLSTRKWRVYSLDTRETRLLSYGTTYEDMLRNLDQITKVLQQGFTLSAKDVREMRVNYDESEFFIMQGEYLADRNRAFFLVLQGIKRLLAEITVIEGTTNRSKVLKHNLAICLLIVEDLKLFVENFQH